MKNKKINLSDLGGIMFSTNSDYEFDDITPEIEVLSNKEQDLRVLLDRKNRGGKVVTLVQGFAGPDAKLQELSKLLKSSCGVGGTAKAGAIMIQGDFRDKILQILQKEGYKAKKSGG